MKSSFEAPLPCERVLIDKFPDLEFERGLVISPGRAQVASLLHSRSHVSHVTAWYLDLYQASQASEGLDNAIKVECRPDLPDEIFDLVVFPISMRGEAELTRDLLQQSHQRLREGGALITSVDNPRDQWLREQMEPMFDKVTCIQAEEGRVYLGHKTRELRKIKNFAAEVVFRDEDQLIKLITRPGVFAHRSLDPGARQLLLTMDIEPGQHVLDLGCGSGALALATRLRHADVTVLAVDSNARAIDCTKHSSIANALTGIVTRLDCDGHLGVDNTVDVVLCNPPYYSDFQIAEKMLRSAYAALRPGGAALFVNKQPKWYEDRFPTTFEDVELMVSGKYWVACGRKPM